MSLLIQAQTSEDDDEINECLQYVLKASRLGLIHESANVNNVGDYTRSWFACAECILLAYIESDNI
jgi:meiotically up-regulated gene 157 (Mug157) protein